MSDIEFSSDDELLQQALPVDDYNPECPPDDSQIILSANDYLRHVRYGVSLLITFF